MAKEKSSNFKQKWSAFHHSKFAKRFRFGALLFLLFAIGMTIGLNNNPKYLSYVEQQNEIKSQVDEATEKIQKSANEDIAKATEIANKEAEKKMADAKSESANNSEQTNENTEVETVEKIVEKKVQFVHEDCEWLVSWQNNLFSLVEGDIINDRTANIASIRSTVDLAHNAEVQKATKNCLNNQGYIPTGTRNGRANQPIWDNWR